MSKVLANGKKATHAEIEERVTVVYTLLIRGASREEILRHGAEKWTLATRQMEDYLARANRRLKELAAFIREEEIGRARAQLHDLYGKNMKVQDYRSALAVRKDLSELLGLYAPVTQRTEHSGPGGGPVQIERVLDVHELRLRLARELDGGEETTSLLSPPPEPTGSD